jgi:hypothetical protein
VRCDDLADAGASIGSDDLQAAGDNPAGLGAQELPPCLGRSPRCGLDPGLLQDRRHSAGRDPDTESGKLALDPAKPVAGLPGRRCVVGTAREPDQPVKPTARFDAPVCRAVAFSYPCCEELALSQLEELSGEVLVVYVVERPAERRYLPRERLARSPFKGRDDIFSQLGNGRAYDTRVTDELFRTASHHRAGCFGSGCEKLLKVGDRLCR